MGARRSNDWQSTILDYHPHAFAENVNIDYVTRHSDGKSILYTRPNIDNSKGLSIRMVRKSISRAAIGSNSDNLIGRFRMTVPQERKWRILVQWFTLGSTYNEIPLGNQLDWWDSRSPDRYRSVFCRQRLLFSDDESNRCSIIVILRWHGSNCSCEWIERLIIRKFSFNSCTIKRQWKLFGISLNFRVMQALPNSVSYSICANDFHLEAER